MALPEAIGTVLATAQKLKSGTAGNEANTKALLIEPLVLALGWDLSDIDAVGREVKVFDGTFLDYAFKIDGVPRVYLEAKGMAENLDDKKFVSQTVNYANNDGVLWCVLTNGLRYRVYKTNEPVAMDQKLLFEVDLTDDSESRSQKARVLGLISRNAVDDGSLNEFGDRVFTDTRVRRALAELAAAPPEPFLATVTERLGIPIVPPDSLYRSLARVLDASVPPPRIGPTSGGPTKPTVGPPEPAKGPEYDLEGHHLANKSSLVRELWADLDKYALGLGSDVTRRVRKFYIGYFRNKRSFFTIEIQKGRLLVYLSLRKENAQPWNDQAMRDASGIGHYGMGDIEYSLATVDQLDELHKLIGLAYGKH